METYSNWELVPEHLKTRTALKKLGLKPKRGQKPAAVKTHWHWKTPDYDLYDMRECVPNVVSEKQKEALEKAKAASLEKRTCTRCGWVEELSRDYRGKWYVVGGLCPYCREKAQRESDRAEAIEWAGKTLEEGAAIILDSETTDLYGEMIELAIINLKGETVYNSRFKNSLPISPGAQEVHGISEEMLADAPLFCDEHPKIKAILETAPMVLIYNAEFDCSRLAQTCQLYDLPHISLTAECLMLWYAQFIGDWSSYHKSYRWQPLFGGDHSALGDCRAALRVLKEMANADESDQASGHAGDGGAAGW